MQTLIQLKKGTPIYVIAVLLACLALSPQMRAACDSPDPGCPGGNLAEGFLALGSLTTGLYNTGIGVYSLLSITDGSLCTSVGAGALLSNSATENTATGAGALFSNTTGENNTASGAFALFSNTIGAGNTATGDRTLFNNTEGTSNTAMGTGALFFNTEGNTNAAIGRSALFNNTEGNSNTAIGGFALHDTTTGANNTAIGVNALFNNSTGSNNTATGEAALQDSNGSANTAIGEGALASNTGGSGNTALGFLAGFNVTTADNVICIGTDGANVSDSCYIGNIRDVPVNASGVPVVIDLNNQLGTIVSSRQFKNEIKPMNKASEAILALKPVTFHYKSDTTETPQFGLIAEEVAEVNPDLVVRNKNGEIWSVRYEQINAMLLNEFLKEHRKNEEQQATIAQLKSGMEALTATVKEQAAQIQKVSAQLEASKPAPQVVNNP